MPAPARTLRSVQTKTAAFTASPAVNTYNVDTSGGAVTVTLPAPSTISYNMSTPKPDGAVKLCPEWTIIRTTATVNNVTISPASGTINGGANVTLGAQWAFAIIWTDGTNYFTADGT